MWNEERKGHFVPNEEDKRRKKTRKMIRHEYFGWFSMILASEQ